MSWVLTGYAPLLLITLAVECAILAALAPRGRRGDYLLVCVALNLLTHPLAALLGWQWGANPLVLELLVFFFEWLVLAQLLGISQLRAAGIALLANVSSVALGFFLWLQFLF